MEMRPKAEENFQSNRPRCPNVFLTVCLLMLIVLFFIDISDVSQFARQLKENPAGSPQYGVLFSLHSDPSGLDQTPTIRVRSRREVVIVFISFTLI